MVISPPRAMNVRTLASDIVVPYHCLITLGYATKSKVYITERRTGATDRVSAHGNLQLVLLRDATRQIIARNRNPIPRSSN